jgi:hypothetical protein
MTTVLIERCSLRIVRHGGWSWGPDPGALRDDVLHALPVLIGSALARVWKPEAAIELSSPVRLHVKLSRAALEEMLKEARQISVGTGPRLTEVTTQIAEGFRAALEHTGHSAPSPPRDAHQPGAPSRPDGAPAGVSDSPVTDPQQVLVAWLDQGCLHERLEYFTEAALEAWHDCILSGAAHSSDDPVSATWTAEQVVQQLLDHRGPDDPTLSERLRLRLVAFATLADRTTQASLSSTTTESVLRRLRGDTPQQQSSTASSGAKSLDLVSAPGPAPREAHQKQTASIGSMPLGVTPSSLGIAGLTECQIECAVPFLLLGPLSRIGYLSALAAAFSAATLSNALPLLATALAYKVLAPPSRGWLRTQRTLDAAAVFALLPQPATDDRLEVLARRLSTQLSPLNGLLATTLLQGHRSNSALLLSSGASPRSPAAPLSPGALLSPGPFSSRLLLSDLDGSFLIAAGQDVWPSLQRMLQSIVLVSPEAASSDLLARLDRIGIRFVTPVRPRGSAPLRALPGRPGERWWTNDPLTPAPRLVKAAHELESATQLATDCWQAFGIDRPAIPRSCAVEFDRALTLAVTTALGSIAWELWHKRETTSPQLALQRFQDLSARIRIDAKAVHVHLPLGRRFWDLLEKDLLNDVRDVPWLGGRVLTFASG